MPDQDNLRRLLTYYRLSGVTLWKRRPRELFNSDGEYKRWNRRYAGKPAGSLHRSGYVRITLAGKVHALHRVIWAYVHGEAPVVVDHINGNRSDNRLCNLRAADHSTNMLNLSPRGDGKYRGVYFCRRQRSNPYRALLVVSGVRHHLGLFPTPLLAAVAYWRKRQELGLPRSGHVPPEVQPYLD